MTPAAPTTATRRGRFVVLAALTTAFCLYLPSTQESRLAAAVSLTAVTPYGASAGVTVQITGTGFDLSAANNSVTLTSSSGPSATVVADSIATLDAFKGLRRIGIKVPASLPIGPAAVRVVNTVTGESASGATLQVIAISLPDVRSGARGAQSLSVRVNGTANVQFVAGRTTPSFGAGVTVTSTQVTSPTSLLATVTVSSAAPLGARTVTVVTSMQTAQLAGAFTITSPTSDSPPTANAGPDPTLAVGSTVTLNGSASSDPEGHSLTFGWSFVSKPAGSGAVLSDATAVMPTFLVDRAGTYELQLIVSDGAIASAPDSVRVSTQNSGPVASAGPDQTAAVTNTVRLDGRASSDPDGDSLTFSWSFVSVPAGSTSALSSASSVDPTFIVDRFGDYIIQLVVSDGVLSSLTDTVTISTVNSPPVANAGPDQSAFVGNAAALNGSGSSDVDGNPLTFRWSLTSTPPGSVATPSNPTAVDASFVIDTAGTYVAQLIVNDGTIDSAPDTVTVTTLNSAPIANAGPDQVASVGDSVRLTGAGSTDVDGNALTFSWSLTTRPAGSTATLSDPTAVIPTFVVDRAGTYIAQLTVNDGTVDSAPDTVSIGGQNQSPVANAGVNQTVALGANVQLDGSASSDPNGEALTFTWSLVSRPDGSTAALSDAAVQNPTFTADRSGSYVAQLIVNDGTANSAPHSVTISTLNSVPLANAGPDQRVVTGSIVLLDGSGSFDPDGVSVLFAWSLLSRPAGSTATLSDPTIGNPTFVADTAGVYVAQLIAGDGSLVSTPDTVTITVQDAADLRVAFHPPSTTLNPPVGTNAEFFVILTNDGPATATDVTAHVQLPAGYASVRLGTLNRGTYDIETGTWTIDSLTPGQEAHLGVSATVNPTGPYDVTAAITGSSQPDPNLANNTVTAIVTPNASADLRVAFHAPSTTFNAPVGTNAQFFVILTNTGPSSTTGVTARVQLPAGYTFSSVGEIHGTYDVATGTWTIDSLIAGQEAHLSLAAVVNPTGPYDVTATVTGSSQPDSNPANNTVTAVVTVNPNAELRIAFTNPPAGNVAFGQDVSVRVDVDSSGPATTTGVIVHFPVPAGYTFGSVAHQGGTVYNSATGDWTIGSMASGAQATLILTLRVNTSGPMNLAATIAASSQPDPNLANNTATAAPPNRPPIADAGADQTANNTVVVSLAGGGSRDPDGDAFTFRWAFSVRPGSSAALLANADAATPSFIPDQGGRYDIQLVVTDSHGVASAADTATVLVTVVNRAPSITSTAITSGAVSQLYRYDVNANDPDAGDVLTFSLTTAPAGMTIDAATGVIAWTPSDTQGGPQSVTVRVQDAGGLFDTKSFAVQVSSTANQAPVAADDASEVRVSESLSVGAPGVLANDADADGNHLTARLLTPPANGSVILNADGSFTYTPHTLQESGLVLAENINLATGVPGAAVRASSTEFGGVAAFGADDNLGTSWRASGATPGQFLEVVFPQGVTVNELQLFGHRDSSLVAGNIRSKVGFFQLFAANDSELFNSGGIDLALPNGDARQTVPTIAGVRRARFTITEFQGEMGFAELKVIGSALVRREKVTERNLGQLLPTIARASSFLEGSPPEMAIDDTPETDWYSTSFSAGEFFELIFRMDVTVTELRTHNPQSAPGGFGSSLNMNCSGTFTLFGPDDATLFDSGVLAGPSGGLGFSNARTLAVPNVTGVRRVRWTSAGCGPAFQPGFSEFKVFGTAPVATPAFSVAKKFQALLGREVHSTPIVANLTDDNHDGRIDTNDIPDIIVAVESLTSQITGEIKVISGEDGRDLFTAGGPNLVSPWSEVAVGDLDGDGIPEIVAIHTDGNHVIAFEHTGQIRWTSDTNPTPRFALGPGVTTGAASIANLGGGARPHIIVGASVFDADGHLLGDGRTLGGTTGGTGLRSAMSAVANLDLDGVPEIIAGPTAYRLVDGQLTVVWRRADRPDGYVAIGNFDNDPFPEIVIAGNGLVYMLNHDGTDAEIWNAPTHAPVPIPGGVGSDSGGAPTIADLDGDGMPEIGIAGAVNYLVFNRDGTIRWRSATSDRSSRSTGSTAFDLDGDGSVEVIYRDEVFLRVYRGSDGVLLTKTPMGSSTWSEQPVVVDVDNDGHADIVVTSDRLLHNTITDTGVYVLRDIANKWSRTRRIWNQHSYHVTNVNEDGTIPLIEKPHWLVPGLNNFRLNAFIAGETSDQSDRFTYAATDGALDSNAATVRIAARPVNSAPQFTSTPVTIGATTVRYSYVAQATDPDAGEVLTFSLPTAPAGMTVNRDFGFVEWTPSDTQLGVHDVVMKVEDWRGAFALQHYSVQVMSPVTVPNVVSQPQGSAETAISDAGFAVGGVSNQTHPVVPSGSVISQNPGGGSLAAPGSPVSIVVSLGRAAGDTDNDGDGFTANQEDCDDGNASVHPGAAEVPGNGVDEDCSGADAINPGTLDADHDGVTPIQGDCNDLNPGINPGASDVPGNGVDENCNGVDSVAGDGDIPTASITGPADGAAITIPTDIIGTATDAHLLHYRLEFAEVDDATSTVIGSGTTSVVNGVLGRLDPTLLENGLYRARLIVEDVNGQIAADERVYRVDGQAKVGILAMSFIDLQVPVSGIPITVIRTYDSRVKTSRDFGVGWSLRIATGKYRSNRKPGDGWTVTRAAGPFGLPCAVTTETRSHFTEVRLSDREFYRFQPRLMNLAPLVGGCVGTLVFDFVDGMTPGATLEVLGNADIIYTSGDSVSEFDASADTGLVFDPSRVRLTTYDGRVVDLDKKAGVTGINDTNGNALSISPSGIVHSAGKSIAFARDNAGRITRITDPVGHTLHYAYEHGDLVRFTDQTGAATTFSYDGFHNLLEMHDPRGNRTLQSEYDAAGRLIATIDARGNRIEITHDVDGRQETVRDRLGRVSRLEYDTAGNVVAIIDVLGRRRQFAYDARGNQLSETDPLGRTRRATFDAAGHTLTRTDFDGNTATYTYNSRGQVLTTTDPTGRTTSHTYDGSGNLIRKVDGAGGVTIYTADRAGNAVTARDPLGNVDTHSYDAQGNHTSATDALGNTATFAYDGGGNPVAFKRARMTAGGSLEQLITRYEYDAAGRPTGNQTAEGASTRLTYGSFGELATLTDPSGVAMTLTHDDLGRLVRADYADGSSATFSYDAEGRQTSRTDRDGRTTRFDRPVRPTPDGSVERLVTTYADGSSANVDPDVVGRPVTVTDGRGNATTYSYAPNLQRVTDALGNTTTHHLDGAKRRTQIVDALTHAVRFEYDGAGRLARTTFADATTLTVAYNLAGQKITETDQLGRVTRFSYDAAGRLTSVTDPAGGITGYAYDTLGSLVAQTDASGRTTRMEYDAAGRLTRRTRPLGQSESFVYDVAGHVISHTDFNGRTTTMAYDTNRRLSSKHLPDGSEIRYSHTPGGLRTVAGGDTYAYDVVGRLLEEHKASGDTIAYTYDAASNRTSVTTRAGTTSYAYDALNRLSTVVDGAGTTAYAYDAVGNLASTTYPSGVRTSYTYNVRNHLTQVVTTGSSGLIASYSYTVDAAGCRTRVVEAGPGTSSRVVDYTYDAAGRLLQERIDGPGALVDQDITYVYDAVGNRLRKTAVTNADTTVVVYAYDDNDRLLTETTTVTLAGSAPESVAMTGFRLSPVLAGFAATGLWLFRRRSTAVSERRPVAKVLAVFELTAAFALVPAFGDLAHAAALTRARAEAQAPTAEALTYIYDNNGNILTRSNGLLTDTYTYDAENRLVAADVQIAPFSNRGLTTFTYDADGVRTSKTAAGITTTFLVDKNRDMAQVVLETAGAETVEYTYGNDLISQSRPGLGVRFYQVDGQHSTRQLTDAAGATTDVYDYDAFGVRLFATGATPNNVQYEGQQFDPNIGFYYLRARYYAQATGRFITTDPLEGTVFDPASLHRYLYANADPVNLWDPSGEETTLLQVFVALAIGSVVTALAYSKFDNILVAAAIGIAVAAAVFCFWRIIAMATRESEYQVKDQARRALRKKVAKEKIYPKIKAQFGITPKELASTAEETGVEQLMESAVKTPTRLRSIMGPALLSERQERAREVTDEAIALSPEGGETVMVIMMGSLEIVTRIGDVMTQVSAGPAALAMDPPMPPIVTNKIGELLDLLIAAFPW